MTLTYNYTADDLVSWQLHYLRSSAPARRSRSLHIATWFSVLISFASFSVLYFQTYTAAVLGYSIAAVFTVYIWRGYDRQVEGTLRSHAADPQLRGSFGPVQLTLSEDGMREVTPAIDSFVRWNFVTEVVSDTDRIFVRLCTGQAAVISRSSYAGPVPFDDMPKVIDDFRRRHTA
jgi:hypothetical protein